jgi:putative acetyltransferase
MQRGFTFLPQTAIFTVPVVVAAHGGAQVVPSLEDPLDDRGLATAVSDNLRPVDTAVRRETSADHVSVRSVVVAAFAARGPIDPAAPPRDEPIEATLLDALRRDPADIRSGWVAEVGGRIVAHVLMVPVTVGGEPAVGLGMAAVDPAHQRSGHGTATIWAALHEVVQAKESLVVVLGSPTYYGRFGFVPAPVVGVDSPIYPAPYLQALALRVGHPRGGVEYPVPYRDIGA